MYLIKHVLCFQKSIQILMHWSSNFHQWICANDELIRRKAVSGPAVRADVYVCVCVYFSEPLLLFSFLRSVCFPRWSVWLMVVIHWIMLSHAVFSSSPHLSRRSLGDRKKSLYLICFIVHFIQVWLISCLSWSFISLWSRVGAVMAPGTDIS